MSRSKWKGNFINFNLKNNSRKFLISKKLINSKILIHNGLKFKSLLILQNYLGQKSGNFFLTRNYFNKFKK